MTEDFIREIAKRFGLGILKRITTGNERSHFATFELYCPGDQTQIFEAWGVLKEKARHKDFDHIATVCNEEHPEFGKRFIELQSVWCEPERPTCASDAIPWAPGHPGLDPARPLRLPTCPPGQTVPPPPQGGAPRHPA